MVPEARQVNLKPILEVEKVGSKYIADASCRRQLCCICTIRG
jgi:hypothetical protein